MVRPLLALPGLMSFEWVGSEGGLSCRSRTRSSALAVGPQQIQWHQGSLYGEAPALPGTSLCTACPDRGRHMASWAKGPGALPCVPASLLSAAVPKG